MNRQAILPLAFLTLLFGCGREQHQVRAQSINGRVSFSTEGDVGFFPRRSACLERLTVRDESEKVVWKLERKQSFTCKVSGFPLVLGTTYSGFQTTVFAHRLKPSMIYIIEGDDARTSAAYSGGFRIEPDGRVQSFALNDHEVQMVLAKWVAKQRGTSANTINLP